MYVKSALWRLSVLLFWIIWLAGAPSPLANGTARGSSSCVDDTWAAINTVGAPSARGGHTAVWTGTEMIVWGGGTEYPTSFNTGGRYDPTTDTWTPISTVNAPNARQSHTAVWTGTEMIVWGGYNNSGYLNTGGRYDPATDTWMATSAVNVMNPRWLHTAVWTGTEMIVWGGQSPVSVATDTGGRYDPATDTWATTSQSGAPSAREAHLVVWTGTEMIVWGGYSPSFPYYFNTGGRYDPVTDTWVAISTDGAPSARGWHTAVWTGTEMLVWGGFGSGGEERPFNTGGRYAPATDTWVATSAVNIMNARSSHTAIWTGTEMIVWGGLSCSFPCGTFVYLNTGGSYDPATDAWAATHTDGAPSARFHHSAVWTGTEMLVWGGSIYPPFTIFNTGGRYCASTGTVGQPPG